MPHDLLQQFLSRLVRRDNLSSDEAGKLLDALLDDAATDSQIAGTLVALASKGETVEELIGMARGLRARAINVQRRLLTFRPLRHS
jgi:anthranilate phosphoribosyltransferase